MRLRAGKLPPELLAPILRQRGAPDRSVLVGPALGEDAAVIASGGAHCLVLKSDPVTFTTREVGWYAVHVNANDIAVMGAVPRWFQATIIVPPGCSADVPLAIARDIHRAARALGIAVAGGHTEVSPAVSQPIVAGAMQGLVTRSRLVRSSGARPGNVIMMTRSAGIEGTAIIARDHPKTARRVLGQAAQARAAAFHRRPGISVVQAASIAAARGVTAMHDPTEGGVAAGLYEMAAASGCRFVVELDDIAVHPYTRQLCDHFDLSPIGLISSGALLAAVPARRAVALQRAWQRVGIASKAIGRVARGRGVEARRAGRHVPFRWSARDELTKLTEGAGFNSRRHRESGAPARSGRSRSARRGPGGRR